MAEMARVLRPGSGRCVLLVAQPHLLGLPGIRRDNVKDRKKRKKERERESEVESVHRSSEGTEGAAASAEPRRSEKRGDGEATSRQAGAISGASGASLDETDEVPGSGTKNNKQTPLEFVQHSESLVLPNSGNVSPQDEGKVGVEPAPGALWRVRARHAVNVGGLMSHLLVVDRTNEPSPSPRSGQRKRLVGVDAYCKHRREGTGLANADPS